MPGPTPPSAFPASVRAPACRTPGPSALLPLSGTRRTLGVLALALLVGCSGGDGDDGTGPTPVTVSVTPSALTLEVGRVDRLTATVSGGSGAGVSWSSSAVGVARVDPNGDVTGISAGTAVVTASVNGSPGVTASAAVTVTEAPLAISLDGFSRDGQPIQPDALSGVVTARVTMDAPEDFEGRIEIVVGGAVLGSLEVGPTGAAATQGPHGPSTARGLDSLIPVVGGGLVRSQLEVPVTTTVFDAETLEASFPSGLDVSAVARLNPGLTTGGDPVEGSAITVRGNNPDVLFIDGVAFGRGTTTGPGGTLYGSGDFTARARLVRFNPGTLDIASLDRLEILKGPQGSPFGSSAVAGVVNITLRADRDLASGGLGGEEGEVRWGSTADIRLTDGAALTVPVANGSELFPGLSGGFYIDNKGPSIPADLTITDNLWVGANLPVQLSGLGLRWEADANGEATIEDLGVGALEVKVFGGFTPSLELGEYLETSPLAETPPALYVEVAFSDGFGNRTTWQPRNPAGDWVLSGIDRTAPAAPIFRGGASYTSPFSINPGTLNIGWDVGDVAGGGGVTSGIPERYRLRGAWGTSASSGCFAGTPTGTDCAAVILGGGIQNGFVPDLSGIGSAEFTLSVGAFDGAGNAGPFGDFHFLRDQQAPALTGTPTLSSPLSGRVSVSGVAATDDLELSSLFYFGQYAASGVDPLTLLQGFEPLGTPFDGVFQTQASATTEVDWIRSIETTASTFPFTPTGTIYQPTGFLVSALDTGRNQSFSQWVVAGNQPRTQSFLTGGMDSFGLLGGGPICNPEAAGPGGCGITPTTATVRMEAFTTGQFEIDAVQLYRVVPSAPGSLAAAPFTASHPIEVLDQGGFRQGVVQFTLDARQEGFQPGPVDLFAIGFDASGAGVRSNTIRFMVP